MRKDTLLKRLAACRGWYGKVEGEAEQLLLENTMSAVQDLLDLEGVEWRS